MQEKPIALAALFIGAAAIAMAPILVRQSDCSPAASAFWRMALAAPLLWCWVFAAERRMRAINPPRRKLLALAGLFFACDLATWHLSILRTSIANATLELNLAPIFVALGGWLLFRQSVSRLFLLGLMVTMGGASILIGPHFRVDDGANGGALMGDGLGVMAGFFYACYMLSIKSASSTVSTARIMAVSTTVSALILAPLVLYGGGKIFPADMSGWMILLTLAVVVHVIGQSLIAFGFAKLPAALSSVSLLLQPVMAAIYAWILLGEAMTPLSMLGAAIVLVGIYIAKRAS